MPNGWCKVVSSSRAALALLLLLSCAEAQAPAPAGTAATAGPPGAPGKPPAMVKVEPGAGGSGHKSPGFVALEAELGRAMKELGQKGEPPPYFISYEVHDQRDVSITAEDGALVRSDDGRKRTLDVDVRVGDHKLDSSHTMRGGGFDFSSFGGGQAVLPLDDDPQAIAAVAWAETDKRYKSAVERLLKIKTQQRVKVKEDDDSDDFSAEKPVTFVEPPVAIDVDKPAWEKRVRRLSARFRGAGDITNVQVSLLVSVHNRWLTNSEGSSLQTGLPHVRVMMSAETRADDGMELSRYETFDAESFAGLADEATMAGAADRMIADLHALKKAPLAEPFAGPAILEGKAAGVFFHEIFGHRIEGHRQKREDEGQTFAKKVGEAVMPAFINVYDDPTLRKIGADDLNGFYRFDNEAVPAQRASLIDKGVLKGFLMGRSPARGFNKSNGHGRRQPGRAAVARQGNLVVEPEVAVPPDDLRERLRAEAKRQGKPFGLLFKDISGGFTFTGRYMPQAFKVAPILVYRVWVDGRPDELVRGADIVGTPLASLSKILAASDDYQTFNGYCGAESGFVPVSATSPSLLVQQIEVERKEKGNDKPPLLPAPEAAAPAVAAGEAPPEDDAAVRKSMEAELERGMTLKLGVEPRPYFLSYAVADADVVQVAATFGAVVNDDRNRMRFVRAQVRVGDPSFDNSNFSDGGFSFFAGGGFDSSALEDDPLALRRTLWTATDEAYKRAVETISRKKAALASQAAAESDKLPDFAAQAPATTVHAPPAAPFPSAPLREIAQRVSGIFRNYPGIATSRVNIVAGVGRERLLTSEGTWADQRQGFVRIDVGADAQADDGMHVRNGVSFTAASLAELPPAAEMDQAVRKMADELVATKVAPQPENGQALVLFEGLAAGQIVKSLLGDQLGGTPPSKTAGNESRRRETASEFAGRIGQTIAPAFVSAYDDPTQERGPGKAFLLGSYQADDEGVPGQRVQVVENGVLKALLMSRTPSKDIAKSNGHGRSSLRGGTKGQVANLFVTIKGGLARKALLDRMAKEQKKNKGGKLGAYVVRLIDDPSLGGSNDFEAMFAMMMGGGGGAAPVRPALVSRLVGGKEEPVRGLTFEGLQPKSLKDIVAGGKDPVVLNHTAGGAGGTMQSIITPALLFKDVEVRKQTGRNKKPPLYPHPFFAGK